jgi:hypothetical protein
MIRQLELGSVWHLQGGLSLAGLAWQVLEV